jgi:hypothetical protein
MSRGKRLFVSSHRQPRELKTSSSSSPCSLTKSERLSSYFNSGLIRRCLSHRLLSSLPGNRPRHSSRCCLYNSFFFAPPSRRRRFYTTIYPFYMGFLRVFPSHKKKSNKGELSFDIFRPNMNFLSLLFFQVMYFQMRFLILL